LANDFNFARCELVLGREKYSMLRAETDIEHINVQEILMQRGTRQYADSCFFALFGLKAENLRALPEMARLRAIT